MARCRKKDRIRDGARARCAFIALIGALAGVAVGGPVLSAPISVRVTDGRGAPVPQARVSVWRWTGGALGKLSSATTDAAGRARVDAPANEKLRVVAAAPGWRRAEADLERAAPTVTIRLTRGGAVEIRVRDRTTGRPVTRFSVVAAPTAPGAAAAGRLAYTLETLDVAAFESADGVGRLTGLGAEPAVLVVRAEHYPVAVVPLTTGPDTPVLVDLDRSDCVERRVVDADTGAPIESAIAVADAEQLDPGFLRLAGPPRSGPGGELWLCPSPAPDPTLLLVHPDYAPREIAAPGAGASAANDNVIRLTRGGAVEGCVVSANGGPAPGATIRSASLGVPQRAVSGLDGRFRLERLSAGPASIELLDDRGAVAARRAVVVREGEVANADFDLGGDVLVHVERNRRPAADQTVVVLAPGDDGSLAAGYSSETDADGAIRIPAPALGERAVFAVRERDAIVFAPPPERAAPPPAAPLILQLEGRWTAGVVRDADGAGAIAGARLTCAQQPGALRLTSARGPLWMSALGAAPAADGAYSIAATDARGRFRFWLPAWCRAVYITGPAVRGEELPWRFARLPPEHFPAAADVEISLERGPLLLVSADGAGGVELRAAEVRLHRPGRPAALVSAPLAQGAARIEPDDEGPFVLVVRADGWAPALAGPLLAPDGSPSRVSVTLNGGGWLRVTRPLEALGVGGAPRDLDPDKLRVFDDEGRDWSPFLDIRPDAASGAVVLGPAPPGRYTVAAGELRRTLTIRAPGETVDFESPP